VAGAEGGVYEDAFGVWVGGECRTIGCFGDEGLKAWRLEDFAVICSDSEL
jgi:hypothetical protein